MIAGGARSFEYLINRSNYVMEKSTRKWCVRFLALFCNHLDKINVVNF